MIDKRVACNGAIDLQHAAIEIGVASVVLAPERMSVPEPILVSDPPKPPSSITPEKVVLRLLLPTVKLLAPKSTKVPSFPASEPIVTPGAL
jgi:hypothetical protein